MHNHYIDLLCYYISLLYVNASAYYLILVVVCIEDCNGVESFFHFLKMRILNLSKKEFYQTWFILICYFTHKVLKFNFFIFYSAGNASEFFKDNQLICDLLKTYSISPKGLSFKFYVFVAMLTLVFSVLYNHLNQCRPKSNNI